MKKLICYFVSFLLLHKVSYSQTATQLVAQDTRSVATDPSTYSQNLQFHFKTNTTVGLPSIGHGYAAILGMRAWSGNTGGKAHELGITDDGVFRMRSGYSPTWEAWRRIATEDQNGNTGFGTTSPLEKLHINSGKMYIQSAPLGVGVSSGPILRLGSHNYSDWSAGLGITQGVGVDVFDLDFYTIYGTATQKMKLTAGGYLGINTLTPKNWLQVGSNPLNWSGQDAVISNAYGSLAIYNAQGYSYITSNQNLVFQTGGSNVGIGTNYPSFKLHVNGLIGLADNSSIAGESGYTKFFTSGNGAQPIKTGGLTISNDYNETAPVNGLYVKGNVGIGTTNPGSYKLAVNGDAIFTKVKVSASSSTWPDYVFHHSYKLPTLQEVEAFIKTNKHLPGVPSAIEVEKDGLDVGDNQATLLKKIEELTLYIIEMKKEIEALKSQNR